MIRVFGHGGATRRAADSTEGKAARSKKTFGRDAPTRASARARVRARRGRARFSRLRCQRPPASAATRPSSSSAVSAAATAAAGSPRACGERVDVGRVVAQRRDDRASRRRRRRRAGAGSAPASWATPMRETRARRGCPVRSRRASRPSRMSRWPPFENGEWIDPGSANTSRPCSPASRAVMSDPDDSVASTTSTPRARPLTRRLRRGKFCLQRRRARRELGDDEPARRELVREIAVARGIDAIGPGADHRDAAARHARDRRDAPRRRCRAQDR